MNLFEFLQDNGIDYSETGKNVSTGWIGIQCPFCGDHSDHLGIRISDLRCSCWRCGRHSFSNVISIITGMDKKYIWRLQKSLVEESSSLNPPITRDEKPTHRRAGTSLPPGSTKDFPDIHKDYLRRRNFHPNLTIKKYDLYAVHNIGDYKFRIIVPIFHNRRLVSFTARAIFDEMELRYKNPKLGEVDISPKKCVYNIDSLFIGRDVLITEGVTDVWRWGDGAIGLNGIEYTMEQLLWIIRKKPRRAFVLFDQGKAAQWRADEVCRILYPFTKSIEQISPEFHDDLGEFTPNQINELKKMLRFDQ